MKQPVKKHAGKGCKPLVHKFAEGGSVPYPKEDPRENAAKVRGALTELKEDRPVTVMEDLVGRISESKGQSNALRDAIRRKNLKTLDDNPDVVDVRAAYGLKSKSKD